MSNKTDYSAKDLGIHCNGKCYKCFHICPDDISKLTDVEIQEYLFERGNK